MCVGLIYSLVDYYANQAFKKKFICILKTSK